MDGKRSTDIGYSICCSEAVDGALIFQVGVDLVNRDYFPVIGCARVQIVDFVGIISSQID